MLCLSWTTVNCSRWVTNINEESEPSDAETISSDSEDNNSDSWEDEGAGTDLFLLFLSSSWWC